MSNTVLGILAHVDAGKTTLSESILYKSGTIRKAGRVDNKDAFLDTDEIERRRGITIFSKQAVFMMNNRQYTLLDTPGHADFAAEMERVLSVLDFAILVVSGADGVQGHTRTLWKLLDRYGIPVIVFVNKMDQSGTDKEKLLSSITKELSGSCIDFSIDEKDLFDDIAMCDEEAMEEFLETDKISLDLIRKLITDRKLFPCFFGSALKQTGIDELLDGIDRYIEKKAYSDRFGARVFKIGRDQAGNRLTYLKVTGCVLKVRDLLGDEKINQIRIYNGEKFDAVPTAAAGTVCAVTGAEKTFAGQGFGLEDGVMLPVLEPVLTYSLQLPDGVNINKAVSSLKQLEEEEPELHLIYSEEHRELHLQLMGDIQTEVLKEKIKGRFGLDVTFSDAKILYKETISSVSTGVGHFEPLRHYAEVHLRLEPDEPGSGLSFYSEVSENELARNWQRLIMTHLKEKVHRGVLTGSPITDMKITLTGGKAHAKHTEGGDFRQATYRAVRCGLMKAESVILEPWYKFRLEIPRIMVGRAMTDIEMLHGQCSIESSDEEKTVLTGTGPVSAMRSYQREVAAYTSGKGSIFCEFDGYRPAPDQEGIYYAIGYDAESDISNSADSVFCAHGAGFIVPWYDVERYMHVQDERNPDSSDGDVGGVYYVPGRPTEISAGEDELKAIFERTYGKIERRLHDTSVTIKAPETEYVYKPAKKKEKKDSYLLVDGYNIIFSWKDLADLAEHDMAAARDTLMEILSDYQGYTKDHIILVFDAYKVAGFKGEVINWNNIDIVFTKEAETADQYIEKTAHTVSRKYDVTVATSDGTEQVIIRGQGCALLSSRDLKDEISRVRNTLREEHLSNDVKLGNYLGNYMKK